MKFFLRAWLPLAGAALGFSSLVSAQPAPRPQVNLANAFRAALRQTETVPIEEARVRQQEARVDNARGRLFPQFSLGADHYRQEDTRANRSGRFGRLSQASVSLGVSQTIFDGRFFSGLALAKENRETQELVRDSQKIRLYSEVARHFYGVMSAEREVGNLQAILKLARDRIGELRKRNRIGRSRVSETLTSQSQLAILEAQLKAAEGQLESARNSFSLATGLDRRTVLHENLEMPELQASLDEYLRLVRKRPDILALESRLEAARENTSVMSAGHLPTVSLLGNYYLARKGSSENIDWDAGITVSLPIFSGGSVRAAVREARELETEAELSFHRGLRAAEAEIRTAYHNLQASVAQFRTLEDAVRTTERNYREQNREYGFSLVTNIDVIQALNLYQDAKRTLDRARFQALTAWAELRVAVAQTPIERD